MAMGVALARVDGGVVRTLKGQTFEGQITLVDKDQLSVRTSAGGNIRVDLANVLSAQFRAVEAVAAPQVRWVGRDLGQTVNPGSGNFVGETATLRAGGGDLSGPKDNGYLLAQTVQNGGQIVARISSVQRSDAHAAAALTIRAATVSGAPGATILVFAGGGVRFQYRAGLGGRLVATELPDIKAPCWLKLQRNGENLVGYHSRDGQSWELVGMGKVNLPAVVRVGLAVSAHNDNAMCAATFEHVAVTAGDGAIAAGSGQSAAPKGVVLRQGSVLAGTIYSANDSAVKMNAGGREVSIPLNDLARIYFLPLRYEAMAKLAKDQAGILLANGDFLEGQLVGISPGQVRLSSVLFGLKRFDQPRVAAAVLHEISKLPTRYEVTTGDGSDFLLDRLSIEKNALLVELGAIGSLKYAAEQISEVRIGASRYAWLSEMKPAKIEGDGAGKAAPAGKSLNGKPCAHALELAAGSRVSYELNGGYSVLIFRGGVPDDIPPEIRTRFTALADGKEVYRSPALTSNDSPLSVTVPISGVNRLTIAADATAAPAAAAILLADAALVK